MDTQGNAAVLGDIQQLLFEIKNVAPVEASVYAEALIALEDEFAQFMALHVSKTERDACRLVVGSVKEGSIISILQAAMAGTMPLLDVMMTISEYADYIKTLIDWARGKGERPAIADERKTLKNVSNIVRPTVNDQGAQMNIGTITVHGDVNISVNLAEPEARAVLGFAKKRLADIEKMLPGKEHEGVIFYWEITSSKLSTKAGDKGKIDDIADYAVSVRFADEAIKQQMVLDAEYVYRKAYLVDVFVQTAHSGKVVLYTISRLIDVIDLE